MKRIALLAALAFFSSMAMANSCPKLMKEIDAALPSAKLNAAKMTEVKSSAQTARPRTKRASTLIPRRP